MEPRVRTGAEPATLAGPGSDRAPVIAPLLARIVGAVVFIGFGAIALIHLLIYHTSPPLVPLSLAPLALLVSVQVFYFSRPGVDLGSPASYALLVVEALLVYLPLWLLYGQAWIGLPVLVAGTALLVLPQGLRWAAYAAIVVSTGGINYLLSQSTADAVQITVGIATFGLVAYGLTRLTGLIAELHAARGELATTAVAHERLRRAQSLHDVLGQELSAITPRGELAHRLASDNPPRARQELAEILTISRRALADMRAIAHGHRDPNLDEETRTAASVLAASHVDVRMERNHGELPVHTRALLASVLSAGVGNVLEHSDAERCDITMCQSGDHVSLDIVNDGVDGSRDRSGTGEGNELRTLAERVAGSGGELTAGPDADGRFRLHLTIPVAKGRFADHTSDPDEHVTGRPVKIAKALVAAVFTGQTVLTALHFPALTDRVLPTAVISVYLAIMLAIQLYLASPNTRLRAPTSYALLAVQALLAYLPTLQFDLAWLALPGFLAGSALLVMRPALAWPLFVAVCAAAGWVVSAAAAGTALDGLYSAVSTVIHGAVVYGLTWMVRTMAALGAARVQLAKAAVAEERLRFARDLHDLLGLSLSAIALKTEVAYRLVTSAPEKAREELTQILSIARLALADVRLVASGYRQLSLDEELQAAKSLLAAADIDLALDVRCDGLTGRVGTLLATVLREGVTNVLRHSRAGHCQICLRQSEGVACIEIVNDGVDGATARRANGSGLDNLSYRLSLRGGELSAGPQPDGRFRLQGKVPA